MPLNYSETSICLWDKAALYIYIVRFFSRHVASGDMFILLIGMQKSADYIMTVHLRLTQLWCCDSLLSTFHTSCVCGTGWEHQPKSMLNNIFARLDVDSNSIISGCYPVIVLFFFPIWITPFSVFLPAPLRKLQNKLRTFFLFFCFCFCGHLKLESHSVQFD